jgi:outer membrane lipoprotein SlyB
MQKLAFAALGCLVIAACSPTTTGTVAGATTGAIVGGPVGAVVGGGVGAVTGATAGAVAGASAGAGLCYVYDARGNIAVDRAGRAMTTRC